MNVLAKSKAIPYGIALLVLSLGSFRVEGVEMHKLSEYAQLACEEHLGSIQLVITANQNTPTGSRIKITGSSSLNASLTPNSRLGLSLSASDFPVELALINPERSTLFTIDKQCKLTKKPN